MYRYHFRMSKLWMKLQSILRIRDEEKKLKINIDNISKNGDLLTRMLEYKYIVIGFIYYFYYQIIL